VTGCFRWPVRTCQRGSVQGSKNEPWRPSSPLVDPSTTPPMPSIRPSTVGRHLADLRARSGLTTVELIYDGSAAGWLVVPSLEPG
jgi:hypothetical protein